MSNGDRLPEAIVLSRDEAAVVLFALDAAMEHAAAVSFEVEMSTRTLADPVKTTVHRIRAGPLRASVQRQQPRCSGRDA